MVASIQKMFGPCRSEKATPLSPHRSHLDVVPPVHLQLASFLLLVGRKETLTAQPHGFAIVVRWEYRAGPVAPAPGLRDAQVATPDLVFFSVLVARQCPATVAGTRLGVELVDELVVAHPDRVGREAVVVLLAVVWAAFLQPADHRSRTAGHSRKQGKGRRIRWTRQGINPPERGSHGGRHRSILVR